MSAFIKQDGSLPPDKITGPVHNPSHDYATGMKRQTTGNIARDGAPKRTFPVQVHAGMTKRQSAGMFAGTGMGHASESAGLFDHVETSPLKPVAPGKLLPTPQTVRGQRSRLSEIGPEAPGAAASRNRQDASHHFELGRLILAEAMDSADHNTRQAFGDRFK